MAGHFHTLPPTFIGGRQPYAPKPGLPQSGPVPQAPPIKSGPQPALEWWLVVPAPIGGRQPYAPRLGLVPAPPVPPDAPPLSKQRSFEAIYASWWFEPPRRRELGGIGDAGFDRPPPRNDRAAFFRELWEPPAYRLPRAGTMAPLLPPAVQPSAPPTRTAANQFTILEQWNLPTPRQPPRVAVATSPIPQAPPPRDDTRLFAALERWNVPPPQPPVGDDLAPLLPAPAAPQAAPQRTHATLFTIVDRWNLPPPQPPTGAHIVPLLPIVNAPPTRNTRWQQAVAEAWTADPTTIIWLESGAPFLPTDPPAKGNALLFQIRAAWEPPAYRLPMAGRMAPFIPAPIVPDTPPRRSLATLTGIIDRWNVVPPLPPVGPNLAPLIPAPAAPDDPPRRTHATLFTIVDRWNLPPPQPPTTKDIARLFPVVLGPPYSLVTLFKILEEHWKPPPPWRSTVLGIAPVAPPAPSPDAPPRRSYATHLTIVGRWNVPPPQPPVGARIAPLIQVGVTISLGPLGSVTLYSDGEGNFFEI